MSEVNARKEGRHQKKHEFISLTIPSCLTFHGIYWGEGTFTLLSWHWGWFGSIRFPSKTLERLAYCWEFVKEHSANFFFVEQTYLIEGWVLKGAPSAWYLDDLDWSGAAPDSPSGLQQRTKHLSRAPRFLYLNMAHISQNSRPTREKIRW